MNKLYAHYSALGSSDKAHSLAFLIFLIATSLRLTNRETTQAAEFLLQLAFFGFATGFCLWLWPYAVRSWSHPVGKVTITISQVICLILATVFARKVVASAIGLPPQDFDIAVSCMVVIFYLPALAVLVGFGAGLFTIGFELYAFFRMVARAPVMDVAKAFAHMAGALITCFLLTTFSSFFTENERVFHPLVKRFAFLGDFQPAPLYPGVLPDERIRLHENGVISTAKIDNDGVKITVREMQ